MRRNHRELLKKIASMVTALLMLWGCGSFAAAAPEDWALMQIELTWTGADGLPQVSLAMPLEEYPYSFWAFVPEEAVNQLTLTMTHPEHTYFFVPESGTALVEPAPVLAGETVDQRCDAGNGRGRRQPVHSSGCPRT